MGVVNQKGKSSSMNRKKIFKNRIRGLEKKFYELRTLCNVEAAGVVNSGYLRNGVGLLPENSDEFHEVLMRYRNYKIHGNNKKKGEFTNDQRLCPNLHNLCVESLSGIERDLESIFVMIAEKENQWKGVISSSSSKGLIPYCDQDEKKNFGVFGSTCYDYASSSSSKGFIPNCDQDEKNKTFVVSDSSCLIRSSKNAFDYDYASTSFSSDFNQVQQSTTLHTAADYMVSESSSDMIEMEVQRLNCSSYMEMINTDRIDGPKFLLC